MVHTFENIAAVFKELRIARGLSLKDIAQGPLSVSQLSRFENGQSMLAADKLLIAISGIHLTLAEFGYALNNYKLSGTAQLSNQLIRLQENQDIEGLKELLATYDDEVYDVYKRLNRLVIECRIKTMVQDYVIDAEAREFLAKYLYSIEEWTNYELFIFGSTMNMMSTEDLIFLGKAFIERDKFYLFLRENRQSAQMVLTNLLIYLILRSEFYYVAFFIKQLESLIEFQDLFSIALLKFFKLTLEQLDEAIFDDTKILAHIEHVRAIGGETFALMLETNLADFKKIKES